MGRTQRNIGRDNLLDLDGVTMFVCDKQSWWVKFQAKSIKSTAQKPHGLDYSLTLHAPDGKRIIGYDNAHTVRPSKGPGGKKAQSQDHRHRYDRARPYKYVDAGTLLEDFWKDVNKILKEKGLAK